MLCSKYRPFCLSLNVLKQINILISLAAPGRGGGVKKRVRQFALSSLPPSHYTPALTPVVLWVASGV